MKKLIGLVALGLLLSGCEPSKGHTRQYLIICFNSTVVTNAVGRTNDLIPTFSVVTDGNIKTYAFEFINPKRSVYVLSCTTNDGHSQTIDLTKNDCWIY